MIYLIAQPGIDLKGFVKIVGQNTVNEIDSKQIKHISKFAELTDKLLELPQAAYRHLYYTFYVNFPHNLETQCRNFKDYNKFEISCTHESYVFTAIMSGSQKVWVDFIDYLKCNESLIELGLAFEKFFETQSNLKALR